MNLLMQSLKCNFPQLASCPKAHWIPRSLLILATCSPVLAQDNVIPVNDANFTNIRDNLDGHYQLTEDVYMNQSHNRWEPLDGILTGSLDCYGHRIYRWIYNGGSNSTAFFKQTNGARFKDIILEDFEVSGSPAAPLVITGDNTQVDGFDLRGGTISGFNSEIGEGGSVSGMIHTSTNTTVSGVRIAGSLTGGDGDDDIGGAVAGVIHTGTNTTVSGVLVAGSLTSGSSSEEAGGAVAGVIHTGTNTIVSVVLVTGSLSSGSGTGSHSEGGGGAVAGVIHTGTNTIVNGVLVTGSLSSGHGSYSGSDYVGEGNGGTVAGVIYSGANTTVSNVLVTGGLTSGSGTNSDYYRYSGDGGAVAGVIYSGTNTRVSNVLVTGKLTGGDGGAGDGLNDGGNRGVVEGVINLNSNTQLFNTYYRGQAGVSGGSTIDTLKMLSTYSDGFNNWRKAQGEYPFPEAVDGLYLQARVSELMPLDCGEYTCPPSQPVTPALTTDAITTVATTEAPTTEAATTVATTETPTTEAATMVATTETPTTEATTTVAITEAPTTEAATTVATTETPTTEATTTVATTETPTTEPLTTNEVTTEPTTDSTCPFTDQSPGTIEHLLYDGQRYHAIVKTNGGGAYWATYEKDGSFVPLGSCGVYDFTDLSLSGTDPVVEAVINRGDSVYVAFHAPETQPVNPMLAMLTLLNGQPSPEVMFLMSPDDRVVSLSVDEPDVLVNTGQAVYRLSDDNGLTVGRSNYTLRANEAIQSVAGDNGDLYFLTHELETGYRLRVVPAAGASASFMVTTSSGVATSKPLITSLNISDGLLHLLVIDGSSVIWKTYKLEVLGALEGLDNTSEEAQESEVLTTLPQDISPAAITFIPEMDVNTGAVQGQVFVLGQRFDGFPQYARLLPSDFMSSISDREQGMDNINNWPGWAKTVFGTAISVTVVEFAMLTALTGCLIRKAWSRYNTQDLSHYNIPEA